LEEVGLALGVIGGGRPRPVYLVGGFGGFSRALAEAIGRGGELTLDGLYERFPRARDVWAAARELVPGAARPLRDPAEVYAAWAAWLDGASWSKLDDGLTDAENEELAETIDVDRVVELVVRGLRAVRGAP
ncbi:MAG TPA: hypothetical protein PKA64_10960, partial [Myxococcota bacterium]|nr:hypothetical protein [Myxococcota bacterium]